MFGSVSPRALRMHSERDGACPCVTGDVLQIKGCVTGNRFLYYRRDSARRRCIAWRTGPPTKKARLDSGAGGGCCRAGFKRRYASGAGRPGDQGSPVKRPHAQRTDLIYDILRLGARESRENSARSPRKMEGGTQRKPLRTVVNSREK